MKIDGATVLVTGGASGIGACVARHLRDLGARVWVVDRDTAALERSRAEDGAGIN